MRQKWFLILAALIVFLSVAPLIASFSAGVIANHFDCRLGDSSMHACMISGTNYGETLHILYLLGWFGIATIQAGVIALALLSAIFIVSVIVRFVQSRREARF